ncbi:hypothetical protein R5R35_014279 [Gryllus longicercus]|uniref:Carboxylic ester hydrolase n=1 Tax=Gryllus longicercus TaxID=2509291 RepID=A0AAN9Z8Q0_9ORTH
MSGFVTVSVRQGALRGRRRQTPAGHAFVSFQGVPFAKPPVGPLRFKAPQAAEPWTGIRDATQEGSPCVHIDPLTKQVVGAEDCLFLNVFTRRLPAGPAGPALPPRAVLVWIHGGGFTEGTGNGWGPEPFMEHDVVLVTFNYRLGPLGFLSLGTKEVPGNAGMKDQTMALRWVKENIAVFGGDPENVTIFGESAGAASVHLHLLSPLSKGLFRRAIAQSGSALCSWAISRDPVGRAKRLAVAAGCGATVPDDLDALHKWFCDAPAEALVRALDAGRSAEERRRGVMFTFLPVVEPALPGAFLATSPDRALADLLAAPRAPRVPVVFGLTSHEGILMLPAVSTPEALEQVDAHFEYAVPFDLVADRSNTARTREVAQTIKDFYFGGEKLCEETLPKYVDLTTDTVFAHAVTQTARAHARLGAPVYLFEFAYVGRLNLLGPLFGSQRVPGACHADELGYLFHVDRLPAVEPDSPEARVRRRMVRMWVDFAQSGNPTPALDEEITHKWEQFSEAEPNYLTINDELSAGKGLFKERITFWDDLYKAEGTQKSYLASPSDS